MFERELGGEVPDQPFHDAEVLRPLRRHDEEPRQANEPADDALEVVPLEQEKGFRDRERELAVGMLLHHELRVAEVELEQGAAFACCHCPLLTPVMPRATPRRTPQSNTGPESSSGRRAPDPP